MKILHTADWHLGAKTEGKNRIEEQRQVMTEIVEIADREKVDIVIIAGDIFDQSVPTSEAEDLFYETLDNLTKKDDRVVVAIAGNHDDPKRITAGAHFTNKHNCFVAGDLSPKIFDAEFKKGRIIKSGESAVEIEVKTKRGVEKCVVGMLPYPSESRFEQVSNEESYQGKVKEWARLVAKGFKKDSFNILATHLMLVGSLGLASGENAECRVGDINAVSKSDLPNADYYALGHIHSYQNIKGGYCYSGAPMKFDFDQRSTGVVIVETKANNTVKNIEFVELSTPAKMDKVEVESMDEAEQVLMNYSNSDIVNLTFVQNEPLNMQTIKNLKAKYGCITKVLLRLKDVAQDDKNYICNRTKMETGNLFVEFYKQKKLTEPSRELIALFKQLMEENSSETN